MPSLIITLYLNLELKGASWAIRSGSLPLLAAFVNLRDPQKIPIPQALLNTTAMREKKKKKRKEYKNITLTWQR